MPQINPRTFADAKQLGDGVYELILTNWGNRGQAQDGDNGSIIFPPVARDPVTGFIPAVPFKDGVPNTLVRGEPVPSLFAIGISPRSTVDRCILQFNQPQVTTQTEILDSKIFTEPDPNVILRGGILETEQVLTVGAPLIGQLNGPIVVRAHPDHWFGDFMNTTPLAGFTDFGTKLGTPATNVGGSPAIWINPELRLLLYMTAKGPLPPHKRAPLKAVFFASPTEADERVLFRAIPVMGRKHITVAMRMENFPGATQVDITGVTSSFQSGGIFGFGAAQNDEIDLGITPVNLSEGNSDVVNYTNDAAALSWILIYVTNQGGLFPSVMFTIEASD